MLFNSLEFILFLPLVFGVYWTLGRSLRVQNLFVVAASYVFYGWWDWRFLILISFTSVWSWASGLLIQRQCNSTRKVRIVVAAALVVNLGILGVFKYCNFFLESFYQILGVVSGSPEGFQPLQIILPVGISFYTFQALSYVIDVSRGVILPAKDIDAFLAYVSFFPQLVAGPIERATNLLPQFLNRRTFDYSKAVDGCRQMIWGFLKKMVVADNCAELVNRIFNDATDFGGIMVVVGTFAFTLQIYGDFSGYSDIAVGCARLFGFDLCRNFSFPYFSRNIADFWRRWHISLNTWFRDYLYIPLGGSRVGLFRKIRNVFVIFLVSGFWHGANWTFVLWGAYHAVLFLPLTLFGFKRSRGGHSCGVLKTVVSWTVTFLFVMFGWMIFRAPNLSVLFIWIQKFSSLGPVHGFKVTNVPWWAIAIVFVIEFMNRNFEHALARLPRSRIVRWIGYMVIITLIIYYRGGQTDFIYFQF